MLLFKHKIDYESLSGNGFKAHLDAPAFDHIGRIEHLTCNLAVDEATKEDGYLQVVVGSHNTNVELPEGGHISEASENAHEWTPVPLKPGDALFFGSHLAHRSEADRSNHCRVAIYATYHIVSDGADLRRRYYAHRREMFPPDHRKCLRCAR